MYLNFKWWISIFVNVKVTQTSKSPKEPKAQKSLIILLRSTGKYKFLLRIERTRWFGGKTDFRKAYYAPFLVYSILLFSILQWKVQMPQSSSSLWAILVSKVAIKIIVVIFSRFFFIFAKMFANFKMIFQRYYF